MLRVDGSWNAVAACNGDGVRTDVARPLTPTVSMSVCLVQYIIGSPSAVCLCLCLGCSTHGSPACQIACIKKTLDYCCHHMAATVCQEARNRRARDAPAAAPADPTRVAEMDTASALATFPPDVRREVLLGADDALLNELPPNLLAEAMVLRERNPQHVRWIHSDGRPSGQGC